MELLNQENREKFENIYTFDNPNKKCNITKKEIENLKRIEILLFNLFSKYDSKEE